jgi:replicative DNA helicase
MSQSRVSISDYGYKHISVVAEIAKQKMIKIRSGEIKPLFTSLQKERDKIGGYYPGDQIVVAGRTGTGKSAKMLHDLLDFVSKSVNPYYYDKVIILFDSWEMPDWRNMLRLMSRKGTIEAKDLLDYQQRITQERFDMLLALADKFKGLPIYISTYPTTVLKWEENKKQIQGKFPSYTIVNVFDHSRLALKGTESKEEELITNLMVAGMRLKNNQEMINFFLSQMNRNIETNVSREKMGTYTPVASDIFGSDAVFQCADIVYALHRPGIYKVEEFEGIPTGYDPENPDQNDNLMVECVLKQRDGWTGNLTLKHNLAHNQFIDYPTSLIPIKSNF